MIEILQFALSTNLGGIETYLKKIWDNIDRNQYHFSFIDMTGENRTPCYYDYFRQTGCDFYKITPRKESPIKNKYELEHLFRTHHFDVLHYSVNSLSYILPISIALKHGVRVLVHSRCAGIKGNILTRSFHYINRLRVKKMLVERIAISEEAGRWLFDGSFYRVYPNGVDTTRFRFIDSERERIRNALNCQNNTVIGHVGTFIPIKNHTFLIDVFEKYLSVNRDAALWLIGCGPEKSRIQEIVSNRGLDKKVFFLGKREDVEVFYAGMDVFVFPSIKEGLGNVLLEAETEGLPCLVSKGVPSEVLITENTMTLDLNENIEKWCSAIDNLINVQIDRSKCFELIRDRGWSVGEEVNRLQKLYLEMINQDS